MAISGRTFVFTGVVCALFWSEVVAHSPVHLPTNDCDQTTQGFCQLSKWFSDPDVSCVHTNTMECRGITYTAAGSTCKRISDVSSTVYKCSNGLWKMAVAQPEAKVRKRRGGWWWWYKPDPKPPPPNRPPYFTYCPSDIRKTASPRTTSKRVYYSSPRATDPENGGRTPSRIRGKSSGSIFPEGTTPITYKVTDSGGLTAQCHFSVKVRVTYCPYNSALSNFRNGRQSCSGTKKNIYGSVCTHTCNTGYQLSGSSSSVGCQSSGSWDRSFPSCTPVSCGNPGRVVGGRMMCPSGYVYPQRCTVLCNTGFRNSGARSVTCQSSGRWTTSGRCVDVSPPSFPNGCPANQRLFSGPLEAPVTLNWIDPVTSDNSGGRVTLTSSPAKLSRAGLGTHTVRITATDSTGNNASCTFLVVVTARKCPPFEVNEGGGVTCTRDFVEGSECTLTCNQGYRLQGQGSVTCLRSRQWSASLPACQAVVCRAPPSPANGQYACASGHGFSSKCLLNCRQGHSVRGPAEIQCLQNSTWSTSGVCLDVDAPTFALGCPNDMSVYASRFGQETLVNWTPPQATDTSGGVVNVVSTHTPRSSFSPGETVVTYTATDPSGNTKTCEFSVTVNVLTCQDPSPNPSEPAMLFSCSDGHVFGAACTLGCSEGHQLVGMETITCEADMTTHPPTMKWQWNGGVSVKPACKESKCPRLNPPPNGALSCFLGDFGWDCLMSCRQNWDVPASFNGHFYCTNVNMYWVPGTVPDCVGSGHPTGAKLHGELFYMAKNCDQALDELRRRFVTRMNNSTFKDACLNVQSCVAENVEVTCGPVSGRMKREVNSEADRDLLTRIDRVRRATGNTGTHYVLVTFHINVAYEDKALTHEESSKVLLKNKEELVKAIRTDTRSGLLDVEFLKASEHSLMFGPVEIVCPPGSLPVGGGLNKESFTCVGCGAGHYLPVGSTQCEPCPAGSYTELDNATSCTPCPPGWSTPTTGSKRSYDCKAIHTGD